jgi:DNA gyrase/topoisomerase IV subunit B
VGNDHEPTNRTLLQVTVDDAAEADRTFDMLMGDAVMVFPRPAQEVFIQTHAKSPTFPRESTNLEISG